MLSAWQIVNPDGSIKCIKVAVDPVWHLPKLAEAVGVDENLLRERLSQWTQNELVLDSNNKIFLPSIGGTTLYLFGDPSAITDPDREVACRPHDECNGSDVFGTDICTCRPYLAYVSLRDPTTIVRSSGRYTQHRSSVAGNPRCSRDRAARWVRHRCLLP